MAAYHLKLVTDMTMPPIVILALHNSYYQAENCGETIFLVSKEILFLPGTYLFGHIIISAQASLSAPSRPELLFNPSRKIRISQLSLITKFQSTRSL